MPQFDGPCCWRMNESTIESTVVIDWSVISGDARDDCWQTIYINIYIYEGRSLICSPRLPLTLDLKNALRVDRQNCSGNRGLRGPCISLSYADLITGSRMRSKVCCGRFSHVATKGSLQVATSQSITPTLRNEQIHWQKNSVKHIQKWSSLWSKQMSVKRRHVKSWLQKR